MHPVVRIETEEVMRPERFMAIATGEIQLLIGYVPI